MRLFRTCALVALLVGVFVPAALAGGYTDESYYTPVGKVGTPYSHTVSWKPGTGCPPYTYSVVGGTFPPGLTLSIDGHISGIPTLAGTFTFYIRQTDNCGIEGEGNAPFVIKIEGGAPPLVVSAQNLASGEADLAYAATLSSSGGAGSSRAWSVSKGALPPGLSLSSDGHITGTPTTPGTFSFTATVSDGSSSSSRDFALTVIPGITVDATPDVPPAEVRTPYSVAVPTLLGISGGVPPYRYAPVSGFPFGIGFDSATGTIFGSPRAEGTVDLTIQITDANGATKQVTVSVRVLPKLHILRTRLAAGKAGKRYRASVSVSGGLKPSWAITAGVLPKGLKLDPATGTITGVPRRAGSSAFTVTVTDSLGAHVTIRYTLLVRK